MSLVFVPTPLGNLRDITLRGIEVLRDATAIVAEDSRVARRLLNALEIGSKPIFTYHEHNARAATEAILLRAAGDLVAVVTDAGTPGISDPGSDLVRAAREAGVAIEVLPGPSAFVCAAVLSGFDLRRFSFEGFPPRTAGARRSAFAQALDSGVTSVWYESPHRILDSLAALETIAPQATIFVVRELSKLHEQQLIGTPAAVAAGLAVPVRGEIAFVLAAQVPAAVEPPADETIDREIDRGLAEGRTVSAIAKELAGRGFGDRRHLYARTTARKREDAPGGR